MTWTNQTKKPDKPHLSDWQLKTIFDPPPDIVKQIIKNILSEIDEAKSDSIKFRQRYISDNERWLNDLLIEHRQETIEALHRRLMIWRTPKNKQHEYAIEKIKQIPIENYYPGHLKKAGKLLSGKCPFHNDGSASFFIYPTNTFHCFGCNVGRDVIDFIQKLHNCDFKEALSILNT